MKMRLNRIRVRSWMRYGITALLVLLLLLGSSWSPVHAADTVVVGNGTPESCTGDAFVQALADAPAGGTITFNCGPDPITISTDGENVITKDLTIDGGGMVTLASGGYLYFIINSVNVNFLGFAITGGGSECEGPIENYGGTLTLRHVTVSGSSTSHGCSAGGVYNGGTLTIEDSTIAENWAGCDLVQCGAGGGILNNGSLYMVNSTVSDNVGSSGAGGIFNDGTATIQSSTISGNRTGCQTEYNNETGEPYTVCNPGGGIVNYGTMSLINSTVSGNSTGYAERGTGGGIYSTGPLFVQNSMIVHNTAFIAGGLTTENSVTLQNSILANNTDRNGQPFDCIGNPISQGYNLVSSTNNCILIGDTTGNLLNVDPRLGPLQDNGGPTLTHALLPGSPAIDAGNPSVPGSGGTACEASDQRGITRPQDGNNDGVARCDIGAVEVQPHFLTVTIDIKPGDSTNAMNLKSRGVIPVAILSTSTFDATTVDPSSVTFGPSGAKSASSSLEDVNGDGLLDLVLHFRIQQTGVQAGDTQACLTGQTQSGMPIQGCDSIRIVP